MDKEKGKKKKGVKPSKEEAGEALNAIKDAEQKSDEEAKKIAAEKAKQALLAEMIAAEQKKIAEAQEKVRRKLRENLRKKQGLFKEESFKKFLESGNKIKWKSINKGVVLKGYYKNKLMFEIKRGLNLFSLYIKDEKLMETKKIKSYQGCSMNVVKLKAKSEKFI
jgi:hypothetical protein